MNAVFVLLFVTSLLPTLAFGQVSPASVIVRPPATMTATEGQNVRVTCVGSGNPTVTFTWWKVTGDTSNQVDTSDRDISITSDTVVVSGTTYYVSVLQLCNLQVSDTAVYACNASNSAGSAPIAMSSAAFNLAVSPDTKVPASIVIQPPAISKVDLDSVVELVCIAYGNPVPTISWSREGININNNSLANAFVYSDTVSYGDVTFRKSVLQFCTITSRDSNRYTCSATNGVDGVGVSSQTTSFTVEVVSEQATTGAPEAFFSETGYQAGVAILVILIVALIVVLVVQWVLLLLKRSIPCKTFTNVEEPSPAVNEIADDDFTKMKFSDLQPSGGEYEDSYTVAK